MHDRVLAIEMQKKALAEKDRTKGSSKKLD